MAKKPPATEVCPNCGATFNKGRLACPDCGSDAMTGWKSSEEIDYQAVDLPDLDEDAAPVRHGPIPKAVVVIVAAILLAALLVAFGVLPI